MWDLDQIPNMVQLFHVQPHVSNMQDLNQIPNIVQLFHVQPRVSIFLKCTKAKKKKSWPWEDMIEQNIPKERRFLFDAYSCKKKWAGISHYEIE